MIRASKTTVVRAPGASLAYEAVSDGPPLLLVHGAIADSVALRGLEALLAERHTVVTYDRRGYGQSSLEEPAQEQSIELHADDAQRVLAEVAAGPADVLGLSSGASIGLELACRHPERVRTLVAFEPPLTELLPDREWYRADGKALHEAYRRDGVDAAMARFTDMVGGESEANAAGPSHDPARELMAHISRNAEFFFARELLPFGEWLPDLDALRDSSARLIVAGGDASGTQPARRAADALAELLRIDVVEFPGDHGGPDAHAGAFAARLDEVLRG